MSFSEFILDSFPNIFTTNALEEVSHFIQDLVTFLKIPKESNILSTPSLGGVFASVLSDYKFKIFSLEPDTRILEKAKICHTNKLMWVNHPLPLSTKFDYVLNLGYSFGILEGQKTAIDLIQDYYQLLRPKGILLLQLIGRDLIEKYFQPKYWVKQSDESYLLTEREIDYKKGILTEHYTVLQENQVKTYKFDKKIFYPEEILELLNSIGFKKIDIFGNMQGADYSDKSEYLLICAEKPTELHKNFIKC